MYRLTTDRAKALSCAILCLLSLLVLLIIPGEYTVWISALVTAALAACTLFFVRKRSIHSINKRQVTVIISVIAILYLTLYYLSGLKYGFVVSMKGVLTLSSFFRSILPISLIIVASELIRETLIAQEGRPVTILSYAVGVASELVCAGGIHGLKSAFDLADFFGMILFPALTANILLTHLSRRYGRAPCLAYRLIMTLYAYLIPATSDIPRALSAFVLLLLPIVSYWFIDILFTKRKRKALQKSTLPGKLAFGAVIILLLCFILLITCQFRYGMIVIATESMTGEINVGDAVVFEQYEYIDEIKENDVIVFEEYNRRTVHRVVRIDTVDGERRYITKGDANEGNDSGYRTDSDIVGVVRLKVVYIGYPSLWLRQIMNK